MEFFEAPRRIGTLARLLMAQNYILTCDAFDAGFGFALACLWRPGWISEILPKYGNFRGLYFVLCLTYMNIEIFWSKMKLFPKWKYLILHFVEITIVGDSWRNS